MKTIICTLFFYWLYIPIYSQINGKILSQNTQQAIAYANIIILDKHTSGTTTNVNGEFSLQANTSAYLYISAIGFKDTIVQAGIFQHQKELFLRDRQYYLEEVVVTPSRGITVIGPIHTSPQNGGWRFMYPGQMQGIFYKTKTLEKNRRITSLQVYISQEGICSSPMSVRIMTPMKSKNPQNQGLATELFQDLLTNPILFTPKQSGWFDIDLRSYNLSMPENGIILLFSNIDEGEKYWWTDQQGKKYYGAVIANSISDYRKYEFIVLEPLRKRIYIVSNHLLKDSKPMILINLD